MMTPVDIETADFKKVALGYSCDEVDTFLENHYEYRCKPKYKGFFGKIRAYFDRCEEERRV